MNSLLLLDPAHRRRLLAFQRPPLPEPKVYSPRLRRDQIKVLYLKRFEGRPMTKLAQGAVDRYLEQHGDVEAPSPSSAIWARRRGYGAELAHVELHNHGAARLPRRAAPFLRPLGRRATLYAVAPVSGWGQKGQVRPREVGDRRFGLAAATALP